MPNPCDRSTRAKARTLSRCETAQADRAALLVALLMAFATGSVVATTGAWSTHHAQERAILTAR